MPLYFPRYGEAPWAEPDADPAGPAPHATPSIAGYAQGLAAAAGQEAEAAWDRAGQAREAAEAGDWTEPLAQAYQAALSYADLAVEHEQAADYYAQTGRQLWAEPSEIEAGQ